jgi:predicted O-methyltransferase YrrM
MNQPARELIEQMRTNGWVHDAEGQRVPVDSAVDTAEGELLESLIRSNGCRRTLEVGCAYGLSSLHICGALPADALHTIIDPNQSTQWKGIGRLGLERAGLRNWELIEQGSEIALPKLLAEGAGRFDLIFIDGWHTFDHTLIDCFYATKLLRTGGILVVDDGQMPAVRRVLRHISTYPCYEAVAATSLPPTRTRQVLEATKAPLRAVVKRVPARVLGELLDASVMQSDVQRGIRGGCVAFRKVAEDRRAWDWYEPF